MPYGEEIVGLGNRTPADKYVADDVRQGFTGYEKDEETGLDYAQARMYKKELGRFTGADPLFYTASRPADPQQFNLYIYVRNNPLLYVDPDGRELGVSGDTDKAVADLRKILGTADAEKRITYDKDKGLTIDLKDVDLTKNEGAKLLNDLKSSKKVYEYRISDTVMTAGGERAVGDMANLSNNDERLTATTDKPPSGVDGVVVIDPARAQMTSVAKESNEKLPVPWTTAFHELAESYAKVDGSKQYTEAHADANSREDVLRNQRPELKEFMRGGGGPNLRLDGDKLKSHRDEVNKRLKKKN
jgi:RHS repeat-associated protein